MTIIKEKTFDISLKDANTIIKSVESSIFKIIPNWSFINANFFLKNNFKSEILISRVDDFIFDSLDCQTAKSEIPIQINFGILKSNYMYPPLSDVDTTSPFVISFGFSLFRLREIKAIVVENNLNGIVSFELLKQYMNIDAYNEFKLYFSKDRLQNSLIHEMTHWLDDYYHNKYVRRLALLQKFNSKAEINAQIHVIAMLKIRYSSDWDYMTIFDVLLKDQSLKDTYRRLSELDKKEAIKWLKTIMKRLYREKLLGKKMNNIPQNDMKLMEDFSHDNIFNEKYYNIKEYL